MTTQTVETYGRQGLSSCTMKLFTNNGSDTVVQSVSATEATNRKGVYTGLFLSAAAGCYRVGLFDSAGKIVSWLFVDLLDATGTYVAKEVPDSALQDVLADMLTESRAELAAIPGISPGLLEMLQLVYQMAKHRMTQSDATLSLYKKDGTTVLGTADTSASNAALFDRKEVL